MSDKTNYYILRGATYYSPDGVLPDGARWETEADIQRWRRGDLAADRPEPYRPRPPREEEVRT